MKKPALRGVEEPGAKATARRLPALRTHRLPLWVCALVLVPACASAPTKPARVTPPGTTVITRPIAGAAYGGPATGAAHITAVPRRPAPPPTVVTRTARKPVCKPACPPICLPLGPCCGGT